MLFIYKKQTNINRNLKKTMIVRKFLRGNFDGEAEGRVRCSRKIYKDTS